MATARNSTPAQPTAQPTDPGVFVSNIPVGFVAPSPEDIARIDRLMRSLPTSATDARFFNNLLTIKMLAPEESRELLIYPSAMVVDFVNRLRQTLTMTYYSR